MMRAMGVQPSQLRGITGAITRGRIETTIEPVERIAEAVGFGDAENMRRAFIRIYGQPPQSIRRATRSNRRTGRTLSRQIEPSLEADIDAETVATAMSVSGHLQPG
jgi:hypothetical protein